MKTIVAYKSKSGYTKTYAEWIAQELDCDIKENAEISFDHHSGFLLYNHSKLNGVKQYSFIIISGD